MSMSVCLSVCSHISETTWPNFIGFCACYLWSFRISSFVDDIMFSHCGLFSTSCVLLSDDSITVETTASIPVKFCLKRWTTTRCWLCALGQSAVCGCLAEQWLRWLFLGTEFGESSGKPGVNESVRAVVEGWARDGVIVDPVIWWPTWGGQIEWWDTGTHGYQSPRARGESQGLSLENLLYLFRVSADLESHGIGKVVEKSEFHLRFGEILDTWLPVWRWRISLYCFCILTVEIDRNTLGHHV